jgi:hypothetical protein
MTDFYVSDGTNTQVSRFWEEFYCLSLPYITEDVTNYFVVIIMIHLEKHGK